VDDGLLWIELKFADYNNIVEAVMKHGLNKTIIKFNLGGDIALCQGIGTALNPKIIPQTDFQFSKAKVSCMILELTLNL
jgi:hypothetical protein